MINFATLQGLAIPEGVVTQIAEASGRVIWKLKSDTKVVLQVEKQALNTYAGETEYTGEEFVALDIYPKTYGTVKVTYGGITKTVTDTSGAEAPNAQLVYFGTLYGVSDSVTTPASGELIIEGQLREFGCGVYKEKGKYAAANAYCGCITAVSDWSNIASMPMNAFYGCTGLTSISIPSGVAISDYAFYGCTGLTSINIQSGVTSIGAYAFARCTSLALTSLPNSITSIGAYAFYACDGITSFVVHEGIETLNDSTFESCSNLTYLVLPSTLKTIGSRVALDPGNFTTVLTINVLATTPPSYSGEVDGLSLLYNGNSGKNIITVPKGCLDAYKSANGWSKYAEYGNMTQTVTMKEVS